MIGSSFFSLEAVSSRASPGRRVSTESPERKRASIPQPERMAEAAPAFGVSPSEKRTLDLVTDHPMIPVRTLPSGWASRRAGSAR